MSTPQNDSRLIGFTRWHFLRWRWINYCDKPLHIGATSLTSFLRIFSDVFVFSLRQISHICLLWNFMSFQKEGLPKPWATIAVFVSRVCPVKFFSLIEAFPSDFSHNACSHTKPSMLWQPRWILIGVLNFNRCVILKRFFLENLTAPETHRRLQLVDRRWVQRAEWFTSETVILTHPERKIDNSRDKRQAILAISSHRHLTRWGNPRSFRWL